MKHTSDSFFKVLGIFVLICAGGAGLLYFGKLILSKPVPHTVINLQDPFIKAREDEFQLSTVIPKYDEVITAIERYNLDHGSYPIEIAALVPEYLSQVPGIYIRNGERLNYEPVLENEDDPPFRFSIYGHYPFPAFMHGWRLMYCPTSYSGCATGGDRHIRSFRVNDRWIWIHSAAL